VIDAKTLEKLASFTGEALGPTADERGVVVFRKSRGRLEFHDLRPIVKELDLGASADQAVEEPGNHERSGEEPGHQEDSGEFH
jgi:hypothetical protein